MPQKSWRYSTNRVSGEPGAIQPAQENTVWVFTPKSQPLGQIRFGHLLGIRGIKPGRKLELLPYAGGRAEYIAVPRRADVAFANPFRTGSEYVGSGGLDLKYRVTSNITLDATANPDFGQVEVDPAVLNLTAFETRFVERRPFFVEGAEIFAFGEGTAQTLYSRRIGRPPHGSAPKASIYDMTPSTTTILGAAKLSGKTSSGWSLAALDAVTGREEASWVDAQAARNTLEVEPRTNYFAGRARREMRAGQSAVGAMVTTVHRNLSGSPLQRTLHSTAYSAGLDFSHDFADRAWHISGAFSSSRVSGTASALTGTQSTSTRYFQRPDADYLRLDSAATRLAGYSTEATLKKQADQWRIELGASAISPGYEVNDLGFQTIADRIGPKLNLGYEQTKPGRYARSWNVYATPELAWNYGGDLIAASTALSTRVQLPDFALLNARASINPTKLNQHLTRGGPLARDPAGYSASLTYTSDTRTRLNTRLTLDIGHDESGAWQRSADANLLFKASETLELSLGPTFTRSRTTAQYVGTVADPTAGHTFGQRYLFADLDQSTLSLDVRVNLTLTPQMTFEAFAQPFLSSGDYGNLKELAAPRSFDFTCYGEGGSTITAANGGRSFRIDPDGTGPASTFAVDNKDFNFHSLRSNVVFRWEWRAGSTLFLVWQQMRSAMLAASDPNSPVGRVGNFSFGRDTGDLFGLHPDNVFLIKMSYWLNP